MALNAALTPKSTWGRVIYASLVATLVSDVTDRAFAFLFPDLWAVVGETVRRLLPSVFVAGSLLLVLLAAVLAAVVATNAMQRARRPGMSRRDRRDVIWLVVVLLAAAGIGLIDARLSATPTHRIGASDR